MDSHADERLLRAALSGQEDAFRELDSRYRERVVAFALSRGVSAHDADELAQQTLTQAFMELRRLRRFDRFASWLLTIARNLIVDQRRARDRAESLDEKVMDSSVILDPTRNMEIQDEHRDLFRLARDVLNEDQYRVLWFRYVEELEPYEIAKKMKRSRVWVRVTLCRIRSRLVDSYFEREQES